MEQRQALWGKTIVVTRSGTDADALGKRLTSLGAHVVSYPCFVVRPLPLTAAQQQAVQAALPQLGWVVFASRQGVRMLHDWLHLWSRDLPERVRMAAVGPATLQAAQERFGRSCLAADPPNGDGLAATMLRHARPSDGGVLLPAAQDGRRIVYDALQGAGFQVHFVPLYETVVDVLDATPAPLPPRVDFVLLTSPSCVRGFLARTVLPAGAQVVTIGPTTTAAAQEHGLPVAREAATPSLDGLIDSLESL